MLGRELVEKYNIDVSRLSDSEYAADVEKRIADTDWVYMEYHTGYMLSAQYILYDASQYRVEYHDRFDATSLHAREGIAEKGEVYHTILGATDLRDLFYDLYTYTDVNAPLVLRFEDGFANNLEIPMNVLPMSTNLSVWMDISNFITVQKDNLGFATRGSSGSARIYDINDVLAYALISKCHFSHIAATEKAQRKIIDAVNREFAERNKMAYWQAENISKATNNQYLPIYKKLEFTDISEPGIAKLCKMFSCSVEEISRLSDKGNNFSCPLRFTSGLKKSLDELADLFCNFKGGIYLSNMVISDKTNLARLSSYDLCFEKCKWKGFNFDNLLNLSTVFPVGVYSFDDDCSWSEKWFNQNLEKELFNIYSVKGNSRHGELSSILSKLDDYNNRGTYLYTYERNKILLSYLIYGSDYMSRIPELREELRKLISEVKVTYIPPVPIPSTSIRVRKVRITEEKEYYASMSAVEPGDRENMVVDDRVLALAKQYSCRDFCEDASGVYVFQRVSGGEMLPTKNSEKLFELLRKIANMPEGYATGFRISNRCGKNYLDICMFDSEYNIAVGSVLECSEDWKVLGIRSPKIYYESSYKEYNRVDEDELCSEENFSKINELLQSVARDVGTCGIPIGMYTYCGVSKDSRVKDDFLDPEDKVRFGVSAICSENGFKYDDRNCVAVIALFSFY